MVGACPAGPSSLASGSSSPQRVHTPVQAVSSDVQGAARTRTDVSRRLCQPSRQSEADVQSLRSATRGDLVSAWSLVQRPPTSAFDHSPYVAGPTDWNQLPADVRSTESVNSFKTLLKTFLFRLSAD